MKIDQEVYFVREKPPRIYDCNHPEKGTITKIGKTRVHVKLHTTGVSHGFKIDTLEDASYTYHKLFLTHEDLLEFQKTDKAL